MMFSLSFDAIEIKMGRLQIAKNPEPAAGRLGTCVAAAVA